MKVAFCGVGRSGKTTLAKMLYEKLSLRDSSYRFVTGAMRKAMEDAGVVVSSGDLPAGTRASIQEAGLANQVAMEDCQSFVSDRTVYCFHAYTHVLGVSGITLKTIHRGPTERPKYDLIFRVSSIPRDDNAEEHDKYRLHPKTTTVYDNGLRRSLPTSEFEKRVGDALSILLELSKIPVITIPASSATTPEEQIAARFRKVALSLGY